MSDGENELWEENDETDRFFKDLGLEDGNENEEDFDRDLRAQGARYIGNERPSLAHKEKHPDRSVRDQSSSFGERQRHAHFTKEEEKERLKELFSIHRWSAMSNRSLLDMHDLHVVDRRSSMNWRSLLWRRRPQTSIKIATANLYAATISVAFNGWRFEHLAAFSLGLTLAVLVSVLPTTPPRLASQLDFHVSACAHRLLADVD
jgi:hypothetical protein